jgi:hypothetical protein
VLGLQQVVGDLVGKDRGVAPRRRTRRVGLAGQRAQQPALLLLRRARGAQVQQGNGERLRVFGAVEFADQIGDLGFVARRDQRGQQDQVGYRRADGGQRGVLRLGEDEVRADAIGDHQFECRGLP